MHELTHKADTLTGNELHLDAGAEADTVKRPPPPQRAPNRRLRRMLAAAQRKARKAQKRREFAGIKALAAGGYMVIHPSRVREWQIEREADNEAG